MSEEVRGYIEFIRKRWPHVIEGMTDPEEIGRHLVRTSTAGPKLWCGRNILRELGVLLAEHESLQ